MSAPFRCDGCTFSVPGGRVRHRVAHVSVAVDAHVPRGVAAVVGGAADDDRLRGAGNRPVRWRSGDGRDGGGARRHRDGRGVRMVHVIHVVLVVVLGVILPVLATGRAVVLPALARAVAPLLPRIRVLLVLLATLL